MFGPFYYILSHVDGFISITVNIQLFTIQQIVLVNRAIILPVHIAVVPKIDSGYL